MSTVFIYLIAWPGLVILAIINGIVREKGYPQKYAELAAHQISTVAALVIFSAYLLLLNARWPIGTFQQARTIGLAWFMLTVAFEFLFGRFVAGHSWQRLFHDYNILRGRLWILVLLWSLLAPALLYTWG